MRTPHAAARPPSVVARVGWGPPVVAPTWSTRHQAPTLEDAGARPVPRSATRRARPWPAPRGPGGPCGRARGATGRPGGPCASGSWPILEEVAPLSTGGGRPRARPGGPVAIGPGRARGGTRGRHQAPPGARIRWAPTTGARARFTRSPPPTGRHQAPTGRPGATRRPDRRNRPGRIPRAGSRLLRCARPAPVPYAATSRWNRGAWWSRATSKPTRDQAPTGRPSSRSTT